MRSIRLTVACVGLCLLSIDAAKAQSSFVNWETPHVHPLERTSDGALLLAVNTADARLEAWTLSDAPAEPMTPAFAVSVGLDPCTVRARTATEAWVVNHISDSVSIVDLTTRSVVRTLTTDDEPFDVVFAGGKAFVSCGQPDTVLVWTVANLNAAPVRLRLQGEEPRALSVSPDGTKVWVGIFESGNSSTILGGGSTMNGGFPPNVVSDTQSPYNGQNPPPNSGTAFVPAINPVLPTPLRVGLIVKKNGQGLWLDDNGRNWTNLVSGSQAARSGRPVGWDLLDNDLARIDVATLQVSYATRLMNLVMAQAPHPVTGDVWAVGTDATNEVRFEPNLKGKFVRVRWARVDDQTLASSTGDLNAHLDYTTSTLPQAQRDRAVGDPRHIVWNAAGTKAFVAGMGSNNVVVLDAAGARSGLAPTIEVPEGPTGLVLDESRGRAYVLSRFAGRVSTISLTSELVTHSLAYFDPSPQAIKQGRKHLYDTHRTSGLGQVACASCHVDARMDRLAWDLGDPQGNMDPVAGQNLAAGIPGLTGGFQDFHPMKGPMTTQTFQDIIGKEPLHWRGDRDGLEHFNAAFQELQGDDAQLTAAEMQQYEDFLATIHLPPNPFRSEDNTLPTSLTLAGHYTTGRFGPAGQPLPVGNAQQGLADYRNLLLDGGGIRCVTCHTLPTGLGTDFLLQGSSYQPFPAGPNGERHHALVSVDGSTNVSMKVSQLRNLYDKVGFEATQAISRAGFGYLHDGSVDSIARFVSEPVFNMTSNQQVANMVAFMLSFSGSDLPSGSTTGLVFPPGTASRDTHAAVGRQMTLTGAPTGSAATQLALWLSQADQQRVGLIAKGRRSGVMRGVVYLGSDLWAADAAFETVSTAQLHAGSTVGSETTFTVVPHGTQVRLGVDRDEDGWYDADEANLGTDPSNAADHPGLAGEAYCFGDGTAAPCPCGNQSPEGTGGCLNSLGTAGRIQATGTAHISADTLLLSVTGVPNSSVLFFQGTALQSGGQGAAFGDGLRCAGGTIVRLKTRSASNGTAQYPVSGDLRIAQQGQVTSAGVRTYQAWYRNAANFCSASTFNLTNGWRTVWAP
jgi:YVTN family beta-propeller protein